jgi:hypothetical protein
MDEPRGLGSRLLTWLLVPAGLLVMLPLAVVFAASYYASALVHGLLSLGAFLVRRKPPTPDPIRRPHLLDTPSDVPQSRHDGPPAP